MRDALTDIVLALWRWCVNAAVACLLLHGLTVHAAQENLRFKRLGQPQIETASVNALLQDRRGFVWIGSNDGLFRFDGYQTVRFTNHPDDPASLPSDRVHALLEDKAGRLWVGTREGLARYNPVKGDFKRFLPLPVPGSPNIVKNMISDGGNGIWLATWAGLQHFDPDTETLQQFRHDADAPDSLGGNGLDALARDPRGGLWVGIWPMGLDYLAPGARAFQHFRVDASGAPEHGQNSVFALHLDAKARLWIGTGNGVYRLQDGAPWATLTQVGIPSFRVFRFHEDRQGGLWAGTVDQGLLRWTATSDEPDVFRHSVDDPYSLPAASVPSIMRDNADNLWVGIANHGIRLGNLGTHGIGRLIAPASADHIGQSNEIYAMGEAPGGRLWLGRMDGLMLFDPFTGRADIHYQAGKNRPGALLSDAVFCILQQAGGPLWVGTSVGLQRQGRPGGPFERVLPGMATLVTGCTIAQGSHESLWIGSRSGVVHFKPADGSQTSYSHATGDPGNRPRLKSIKAILEDRTGRVWFGTESLGLDMLDLRTGRFHHFRRDDHTAPGLNDDTITAIHQDSGGRIWLGTDAGISEIVTTDNGGVRFRLLAATARMGRVFALLSEPGGTLWASTGGKIVRIDPVGGTLTEFDGTDGAIDGYRVGAALADSHGKFYFGGAAGMTVIAPGQLKVDQVAPSVAITDISALNRSLARGNLPVDVVLDGPVTNARTLTLPPEQSVFAIEFAALHFTAPALNQYAYQLVGFDHDWVQADASHRNATYTNLDPGNYLFKVKASNNRGLWSPAPTTLTVTILPPFWKTWWFRLLVAMACAGLMTAVFRLRVRNLVRSKRRLEELVAARTAALESSLGQLHAAQAKLVRQGQLVAVGQLVANVAHEINSPIGAVKSSGSMIDQALSDTLRTLPQLLRQLEPEPERLFLQLLDQGSGNCVHLPSRDERAMARVVCEILEQAGIDDARRIASMMVQLIGSSDVRAYLPLLRHPQREAILATASALASMVKGTANIKLAVAHITKIVFTLKAVSQGKHEHMLVEASISAGIDAALMAYQEHFSRSVALVREDAAAVPPLNCCADELVQVWTILIDNALRAMAYAGTLTVGLARQGEWAVVSVRDTGCGIDPSLHDKIFTPFFTTRQVGEGSGLGLDIARAIVERHGGRIALASVLGEGSEFAVYLPLAATVPPDGLGRPVAQE